MIPTHLLVFENDALENDVEIDYQIISWNMFFDSLDVHIKKQLLHMGPCFLNLQQVGV